MPLASVYVVYPAHRTPREARGERERVRVFYMRVFYTVAGREGESLGNIPFPVPGGVGCSGDGGNAGSVSDGLGMGVASEDAVVVHLGKRAGEPSVITVNCPDQTGLGCDLCRIILEFGLSITRAGKRFSWNRLVVSSICPFFPFFFCFFFLLHKIFFFNFQKTSVLIFLKEELPSSILTDSSSLRHR